MLVTDGGTAAAALLEKATRTFADEEVSVEGALRWGWLTVVPSYALWEEDSTYAICTRQLRAVRHAGALSRLPLDLGTRFLLSVRIRYRRELARALASSDGELVTS